MSETLYDILFVAGPDAFSEASSLNGLLDKIFNNPLASFEAMDLKGKYVFKDAADRSKVSAALQKKGDQSIQLKATAPNKLVAILKKNDLNCTVYFTFSSAFLDGVITGSALKEYLGSLWELLPSKLYAAAKADTQYRDVMTEASIQQVIGIFNFHVSWLHWLSPAAYSEYYAKEDLLAAPFNKTEELNDGSLFLQSYQQPGDYLQPGTLENIGTITNYLNEKRKK